MWYGLWYKNIYGDICWTIRKKKEIIDKILSERGVKQISEIIRGGSYAKAVKKLKLLAEKLKIPIPLELVGYENPFDSFFYSKKQAAKAQ